MPGGGAVVGDADGVGERADGDGDHPATAERLRAGDGDGGERESRGGGSGSAEVGTLTLTFAAGAGNSQSFAAITPVGKGATTFSVTSNPQSCVAGSMAVEVVAVPLVQLTDDFSGTAVNTALWKQDETPFDPTGVFTSDGTSSITLSNGMARIAVTVETALWPGLALTTVSSYSAAATVPTTFEGIDRVKLDFDLVTGTGAEQRAGVWVRSASGNFVFSRNTRRTTAGITGWRYNKMTGAADDNPTNEGVNIAAFDGGKFDDSANHRLKVVANGATVKLYLDGIFGAEVSPVRLGTDVRLRCVRRRDGQRGAGAVRQRARAGRRGHPGAGEAVGGAFRWQRGECWRWTGTGALQESDTVSPGAWKAVTPAPAGEFLYRLRGGRGEVLPRGSITGWSRRLRADSPARRAPTRRAGFLFPWRRYPRVRMPIVSWSRGRAGAWLGWVGVLVTGLAGRAGEGPGVGSSGHRFATGRLEARKREQMSALAGARVFHGFQFVDRWLESGIRFEHHAVDDAARTYKAAHYNHGNGVAAADVDGDGRVDLCFTTQIGRNQLWRNLGGGRFEDFEAAGIGLVDSISVASAFADIDNDGDPDLFVSTVRHGNHLFENLVGTVPGHHGRGRRGLRGALFRDRIRGRGQRRAAGSGGGKRGELYGGTAGAGRVLSRAGGCLSGPPASGAEQGESRVSEPGGTAVSGSDQDLGLPGTELDGGRHVHGISMATGGPTCTSSTCRATTITTKTAAPGRGGWNAPRRISRRPRGGRWE